jgi:hypothetical protein
VRDAYNYLAEALYKVYAYFLFFLETFLNTYKVFLYNLPIGVSFIFLVFLSFILVYFFLGGLASLILRRVAFSRIYRARRVGRSRLGHQIIRAFLVVILLVEVNFSTRASFFSIRIYHIILIKLIRKIQGIYIKRIHGTSAKISVFNYRIVIRLCS